MKRITNVKNLTLFSMGVGGGHYDPPVGFSCAASKKVCIREMKLSDF